MISTITRDLKVVDEKIILTFKEYPNWYGIEGIGFIWHGSWSDPEIEYKGEVINSFIVEDTMWERYCEEQKEKGKIVDEDDFGDYMRSNKSEVYELIELAMEALYEE